MTIYVDPVSDEISKEKIIELSGVPTNAIFQDVWVFDMIVFTKLTTQQTLVFEMPIVKGIPREPVTMNYNWLRYDLNQLATEMAVNETNENLFE